jgi:O-antigen/teichoic acid export membrane protein
MATTQPLNPPQLRPSAETLPDAAITIGGVKRLAAGTGIALSGRLLGRGTRLLLDVALARMLGPKQFGLYAIGWTITRIVTLISPLGLNSGVIRFGSRYWRQDDARFKGVIVQSLITAALSSTVLGVLCFSKAAWLSQTIFRKPELVPVLHWFALSFPWVTLLTVAAASTRISQRIKFSVIAEDVSQPAVELFLVFVFVGALHSGLVGAMVACLGSFIFSVILGLRYLIRLFPCLTVTDLTSRLPGRALIVFSLPASLTGVLGVMGLWVNRLFVGSYCSSADVGIYQAASYVPVSVAIVVGAVGAIFSPMAADLSQRDQIAMVQELYRIGTKWTLYAAIPPILIMCFAPRELLTVVFGASYAAGAQALVIMALGQLLNAGSGCVAMLLVMSGHQKITSVLFAAMFTLNLVLSAVLTPRWGMIGAAWSTICTGIGLWIPAVLIAWRLLRVHPYDKRFLKLLPATLLACVAMLLPIPITSAVGRLFVVTTLAVGMFWGTLLLVGLDPEDREFTARIRTSLRLS